MKRLDSINQHDDKNIYVVVNDFLGGVYKIRQ